MLIAYSIFKTSSLAFTDHWLISSILTQCSFRSNRGSWQPWCTLLALPYRRLMVRRRQCRRPSSCSRSSDTTGGLHCHRHMRQPGNIAKNDIGKGAKFFSWLCKDLSRNTLSSPAHIWFSVRCALLLCLPLDRNWSYLL